MAKKLAQGYLIVRDRAQTQTQSVQLCVINHDAMLWATPCPLPFLKRIEIRNFSVYFLDYVRNRGPRGNAVLHQSSGKSHQELT